LNLPIQGSAVNEALDRPARIAQETVNGRRDTDPPQLEEVTDWFALLFGDDRAIEIRAPKFRGRERAAVVSRFKAGDHDAAAREAMRLSGNAPAVYAVMNGVTPDLPVGVGLKGRSPGAKAADIPRRSWLLIDCDPVRPADSNATDGEKDLAFTQAEAIRKFLARLGWPGPICADSGNGAHLLYRVDLPNEGASTELVKRVLVALAGRFDADNCLVDRKVFDAPRLVKAYGTYVAKGENTPERPHRFARVLSSPAEPSPVPVGLLEAVAAEATGPDMGAQVGRHRGEAPVKSGGGAHSCKRP
jgi:hypothetical protein